MTKKSAIKTDEKKPALLSPLKHVYCVVLFQVQECLHRAIQKRADLQSTMRENCSPMKKAKGDMQSIQPKMAPSSSSFPTKETNYGMLFRQFRFNLVSMFSQSLRGTCCLNMATRGRGNFSLYTRMEKKRRVFLVTFYQIPTHHIDSCQGSQAWPLFPMAHTRGEKKCRLVECFQRSQKVIDNFLSESSFTKSGPRSIC